MKPEEIKLKIIELLGSTERKGIDRVIKFLESSDFFEAPASTRYHGNYKGGLAEHSLNVYEIFKKKNIAVGYKSISRTILKHYKLGYLFRKNISEYGRPEYAYQRC